MPKENEKLVVPGGKRDREVAAPAPVSNRDAVHEERARADRADPEAARRRRLVQPESSRKGHGRRLSEARLRSRTDPPGRGERVGNTGPRGHGDAREGEKRGGVDEKTARGSPRAPR